MTARNTIAWTCLYGALGISMSLCLPSVSASAASLSIVEGPDNSAVGATVSISSDTGLSNILATPISLEGPGSLGIFNVSFGYISTTTPVPAAGSTSTTNYNIFEPTVPLTLSDTLHIVITWRTPTTNDPSNVLVNVQFVSDSDDTSPTALTDAFSIFENGQLQTVPTVFGVSDLTVSFQSDVEATPLPAALPLFATGLGVLGLLGWRRRRSENSC